MAFLESSLSVDGRNSGAGVNIPGRMERLPLTGYQNKIFAVIATAWLADQVDVALLTFLLGAIINTFHLTTIQVGFLASMTYLGQLIGNIVFGTLSDLWGRQKTFQITMIVWGIASFLAAISWNVWALMLFRVLIGAGVGGEAPVAQAMVSEFVPACVRGKYIAWMEGMWAVGFVCSGALSFFLLRYANWRWVFVCVGLLALVVFIVRRHLPESPRWLYDKGRFKEADGIMVGIEKEVEKRYGSSLPEPQQVETEVHQKVLPAAVLFQGFYIKRTIMAFGLWFFALMGFFGITSWVAVLLNQAGMSIVKSVGFVTLITIGGIPGFLVAAALMEKIGRKATTALFLVMSAALAYFYGHATADTTLLFIAGFGMNFFTFGMWCCLYAYTPELFPTRARSTGAGFASAFGRIGAITGPIVVGYIVGTIGHAGVFSLGAISFVIAALMVLILGPETKGEVLEKICV